jgi:hypothetical protein
LVSTGPARAYVDKKIRKSANRRMNAGFKRADDLSQLISLPGDTRFFNKNILI